MCIRDRTSTGRPLIQWLRMGSVDAALLGVSMATTVPPVWGSSPRGIEGRMGQAIRMSGLGRTASRITACRSWYAAIKPRSVRTVAPYPTCLLYTSDAADDLTRVDLGGRR